MGRGLPRFVRAQCDFPHSPPHPKSGKIRLPLTGRARKVRFAIVFKGFLRILNEDLQ